MSGRVRALRAFFRSIETGDLATSPRCWTAPPSCTIWTAPKPTAPSSSATWSASTSRATWNFVLGVGQGWIGAEETSIYPLYRLNEGRIVERWSTVEVIPPRPLWKKDNGKL